MKDFWMEELEKQKKSKLKKIIIITSITIFIITAITSIIIYICNLQAREWIDTYIMRKVVEQGKATTIELDGDEDIEIFAYDKYVCIFRKKNAEIYNKFGKKVKTIETQINKPIFKSSGRYLAIAEENGQKFYLISGKEKIYENSIEGNIVQIELNSSGYVGIVISNSGYKAVVDVYNKDGKEIFKTNLAKSRVADISISQDSKYLAIAEIDISGILIQSNIKIISIEKAQKEYEYNSETDKLILNVEYQDRNKLICMYNDSITMIENQQNTEKVNFKEKNISFMSIEMYNKIMLLEEISSGEYTSDSHIIIMNPTNLKERTYQTHDIAKSVKTYGNKIAINLGTQLHIIDPNGFLVKKYISEREINDIVLTESLAVVIYNDQIEIINL